MEEIRKLHLEKQKGREHHKYSWEVCQDNFILFLIVTVQHWKVPNPCPLFVLGHGQTFCVWGGSAKGHPHNFKILPPPLNKLLIPF